MGIKVQEVQEVQTLGITTLTTLMYYSSWYKRYELLYIPRVHNITLACTQLAISRKFFENGIHLYVIRWSLKDFPLIYVAKSSTGNLSMHIINSACSEHEWGYYFIFKFSNVDHLLRKFSFYYDTSYLIVQLWHDRVNNQSWGKCPPTLSSLS